MDNKKNKKALLRRIAISLPAADLEEIEKLSQQRALSVSEYARTLIRTGLLTEKIW
jgi:metal-responsive CopG/Arc/MetJ family transcriptional regulator